MYLGSIRPPSEVKADIPKAIDDITLKALARNPAQRYATAREMGRDLVQAVRESGILCGPVELEQWMEKLFPRERENTRALTRWAKQAAIDASWLDGTPAGFPRVPTRSGAMPKAPSSATGTGSRSDIVAHSGIALRRKPDNDLEATPEVEISLEDTGKAKAVRRTLLAAVIGLSAAVGITWGLPDSAPATLAPASTPATAPAVAPKIILTEQPIDLEPAPAGPAQEQAVVDAPAAEVEAEVEANTQGSSARAERAPERRAFPTRAATAGTLSPKEKGSLSTNASRGASVAPPSPAIPESGTTAAQDAKTPTAGSVPTPPQSTPPAEELAPAIAASAPREAVSAAPPAQPAVVAQPVAPAPKPAKPAASAPPQKLDASASVDNVQVEGSLGSGVVSRMLSRSNSLVHTCYVEAAKRAGKNDFSPLNLSLTIDETGAVRDVRPESHPLPGLASCVSSSVKRLRSERKPDVGTVKVRLQLSFRPQ